MLVEPDAWKKEVAGGCIPIETVFFVTSLIRAKRFYNRIFKSKPDHSDLLGGTVRYSLAEGAVRLKTIRNRVVVAVNAEFQIPVDDFLYEYQRLQSLGVEQIGAVIENQHGETSMQITDEDGNTLTIVARSASVPAG
ncbi:hypothetical protein KI614_09265 [Dechloromonas denitrificans]|uniref:VOC family protein n=1 Tax=Dechloromonas denitrificans TaxID=281362 RepID=UPI001CF8054D|nr:hypothetical protein [Dechloromonas denitrificans]UCV10397.1 hypothetical protein KI614_09265 [Dechloromonas denitrificans]